MLMNNRQRWMGGVVLLGGGVLLTALLLKGKDEIHQNNNSFTAPSAQVQQKNPLLNQDQVQLQALTLDVETEKRLLEEQRRAREKAVAEQEARAAEFLAMQQQAEAEAARKAAEEYAAINALRNPSQQSSDNIPPELVEEQKAKSNLVAEEKRTAELKKIEQQKLEAEKKLAEQKRLAETNKKAETDKKLAEQKRLAEANKKAEAERKLAEERKRQETQRKLEAERKVEAERKKTEAAQAAAKKQAETEKLRAEAKKRKAEEEAKKKVEAEKAKKAEAAKARDLLENGDKKWMVQVALAANQANADAIVSKLRAKGYKITTSPTSKGIRIMVGPSKDREAADSARKRISSDASLNMKSAWVIDWVPLDKR